MGGRSRGGATNLWRSGAVEACLRRGGGGGRHWRGPGRRPWAAAGKTLGGASLGRFGGRREGASDGEETVNSRRG